MSDGVSELKDKIENALNEDRMLVLGVQVLLGFQFLGVFQKRYESLPAYARYLKVVGLGLLLLTLALLLAVPAYHRIVEGGRDTQRFHRIITRFTTPALLPFAIVLSLDIFTSTLLVTGPRGAVAVGITAFAICLFFWYGLELWRRREKSWSQSEQPERGAEKPPDEQRGTPLKERIKQALIEARVVLPGAQALLGFQFDVMLNDGFSKIPPSSQYTHLGSLFCVVLSIVFLMTPAAYHRLVEDGNDSEQFFRFAGRMILAAMAVLALGISGDFFVVVRKVAGPGVAAVSATILLLVFTGFWLGYELICRLRTPEPGS